MDLSTEPKKERESLTALASDILQDAQKLVEQHVQLAKLQFFQDWGTAKPVALWGAIGLVTLVAVAVLTALALVHLLNATTVLPLWACYAVVDLAFLVVGVASGFVVRRKIKGLSFVNE